MALTRADNEQIAIMFQTLQSRYEKRANLHFEASVDLADNLEMCIAAATLGNLDEQVADRFGEAAKRTWRDNSNPTQ